MSSLSKFEPIAEAIAILFHPYVEVVIHDTKRNRIAAIYNSFSQRQPGHDSFLENPSGLAEGPSALGPYEKRSISGKRIKYTSAVLRNGRKQVVGMMCINMDVEVFERVSVALNMFLRVEDSTPLDKLFCDDWQERINMFVHDYLKENQLTLASLTKKRRIDLVRSLLEAGAFRTKNAATYIANVIGVSRATVYNDLNQDEK